MHKPVIEQLELAIDALRHVSANGWGQCEKALISNHEFRDAQRQDFNAVAYLRVLESHLGVQTRRAAEHVAVIHAGPLATIEDALERLQRQDSDAKRTYRMIVEQLEGRAAKADRWLEMREIEVVGCEPATTKDTGDCRGVGNYCDYYIPVMHCRLGRIEKAAKLAAKTPA